MKFIVTQESSIHQWMCSNEYYIIFIITAFTILVALVLLKTTLRLILHSAHTLTFNLYVCLDEKENPVIVHKLYHAAVHSIPICKLFVR